MSGQPAVVTFRHVGVVMQVQVVWALVRQMCGRMPVPIDVVQSLDVPIADAIEAVHRASGLDRACVWCDGEQRLFVDLVGVQPLGDVHELFDPTSPDLVSVFFELSVDDSVLHLVGTLS